MNVLKVSTAQQRKDAYAVRTAVFVEEQHVPPALEIDELEEEAVHFVLYDEAQKPCGAGRFRTVGSFGKVERICVLPAARGRGAGHLIMDAIEAHARTVDSVQEMKLDAQLHAIPFYEKRGYRIVSGEFLDAGILHKTMKKPV